jgi:hypothetical protein
MNEETETKNGKMLGYTSLLFRCFLFNILLFSFFLFGDLALLTFGWHVILRDGKYFVIDVSAGPD